MADAHAWVRALPPDYRIVCKEMQWYFFKVGPVGLDDGSLLLRSASTARRTTRTP